MEYLSRLVRRPVCFAAIAMIAAVALGACGAIRPGAPSVGVTDSATAGAAATAVASATPTNGATTERVEVTAVDGLVPALDLLRSLGAHIEVISGGRIQAQVPSDRMGTLAAATDIVRVDPPAVLVPLENPVTALARIGADRWHTAGFTGHDVKVAVIDAGFLGYASAIGDALPTGTVAHSFRADGDLQAGTDHGLRAAEIVSRVAPGAQIYLLNFGTVTELSAAVDWVISQRIDVVSFSLGFIHNGAGDGTGPVDEIVDRATAAGVMWVAASGNWAEQHWSGVFTDTNGDSVNEFAPGVRDDGHFFNAGDLIIASLRWDDTWGAACSDYDLELFGPDGALVRASRDLQACSGNPIEGMQVLATKTGRYTVRIVQAGSSRPKRLDLMVVGSPDRGNPLDFYTPDGSLSQPADDPTVLTVGAVTGTDLGAEAPYSSRGPTTDGRRKPNLLAPTGLATATSAAFAGTSASAPHVAGALALLREAYPGVTGAGIESRLTERAVPADPVADGTPGVGVVAMGSLAGLGPLLPAGADEAFFVGQLPPVAGLALLSYQGPDGYPLRFAHLLLGGRDADAAFRFDGSVQRFRVYIAGAPEFVSDFTRLRNGDIVIVQLGVGGGARGPSAAAAASPVATATPAPSVMPAPTATRSAALVPRSIGYAPP